MLILSPNYGFNPDLIQRLSEVGVEMTLLYETNLGPWDVQWEEACLQYTLASDNELILFLLGTDLLPPCKLKVTGPNFTVRPE